MGMIESIDLTGRQYKIIKTLIAQHLPDTTVWAYGSRVKWASKPQSDLDLVAFSSKKQTLQIASLREAFEESDLPFRVDLLVWDEIPEKFHENIKIERVVVQEKKENVIPSEWLKITLNQLGTIVTGKTPLTNNSANFGGQIPFITPRDFNDLKMIIKTERYLTEKGAVSVKNAIIPPKTVMVSCIGSDMGKVAIAGKQCVTNQQINSIIIDKQYDYNYVYYNLSIRKDEFRGCAGGSAQPILNKGHFSQLDILLPPLLKQRAIARILGSLDDKIELNQKTNQTLEEMAQAIFKEWFVDFRFPGHEKVKFIDGLPEGWRERNLGDFIDATIDNRGKTPPVIERNTMSYPLVEVNAIVGGSRVIYLENVRKYVSAETYKLWFRKGHPVKNDTLVSTVGSIGEIGIVGDENISIAQNIVALRNNNYGLFLYQLIRSNIKKIKSLNISSVQPSVKVPHMLNVNIIIPSEWIIQLFSDVIKPVSEKILYNYTQIQNLSKIRNSLLPKLINGEINISNIEVN